MKYNKDDITPCPKDICNCGNKKHLKAKNCRKCSIILKKGKHYSPKTEFKKGRVQYNGRLNPNWKGDNVGYFALHDWIRAHKPKTELCECCKKIKPYDIANISGKYKRDINDFEWICRSCHTKKDILNGQRKGYITSRRENKENKFKCSFCNIFKLPEEFHKANNRWNKISSRCKECSNKIKREKYFEKDDISHCLGCGCMTKSIRLGRANYKCGKCGADKSLSDVFFYEAIHKGDKK